MDPDFRPCSPAECHKGSRVEFKPFLPDGTRDPGQYLRDGSPRIKHLHVRSDFQGIAGSQNWKLDQRFKMEKVEHPHGWLYRLAVDRDLPEGYYRSLLQKSRGVIPAQAGIQTFP